MQDLHKRVGVTANRRAEDQVKAALAAAEQIPDDKLLELGDLSQSS